MPRPDPQPQERGRSAAPARRTLAPPEPLPGWVALVQAIVLLGIPITLLLLARVVLRTFFPELGY